MEQLPGEYRVRVVVDVDFGERLARLPAGEPVWIVDSAVNTPVVKRLWGERPGGSHLTGITVFRADSDVRERLLLSILDQVDLHHGQYSADPPYTELEVYGVGPSDAVGQALRQLGLESLRATPEGFIAVRRGFGAGRGGEGDG